MRSRTEMVTTTFVDSEEDYSDDDDSEEDWRPSASSKNGKKQKQQKCGGGGGGPAKRGRKRKSSSGPGNKNSKRKAAYEESEEDEVDELSEDDYDYDDFETISGPSGKKSTNLSSKKQFSDKNSSTLAKGNDETGDTLNLLVYVKDLTGTDLNKNNRLCLWRKDNNNLLQKYIRVKTSPEQYLFTSSSVYSSFDDKRITDFYDVKVKSVDSTNRRVKIINPSELHKIYLKAHRNKNNSDDDILSDEKSDVEEAKQMYVKSKENLKKTYKTVPTNHEEGEDDDEEEVEEENDEEEDDCDLEGDDDDDIEEDDECDDD
ncbi:uncharacterized protein LOC135951453 [Calliphora vicina]|uniref:uncharacterized protein LOC135951453 n=1 Tax=Calliphora vicina TaxID=7373 RepID=UPI00325B301A